MTMPICNFTDSPKRLFKNTKVASIHELNDHQVLTRQFSDDQIVNFKQEVDQLNRDAGPSDHVEQIEKRISPDLNPEDRCKITKVVTEYSDVFAKPSEVGEIRGFQHKIKLKPDARPIKAGPYRKPIHLEEIERQKVRELLDLGIIEPSSLSVVSWYGVSEVRPLRW